MLEGNIGVDEIIAWFQVKLISTVLLQNKALFIVVSINMANVSKPV